MAAPHGHFVDFRKVDIDGHFANFGQVKNWPYSKTPFGENGCLSNFLGYLSMPPALLPGLSDLWRSPPALSSNLTTFDCLLFLIVYASSFLIYPFSQHSQLGYFWVPTFGYLPQTVQHLCDSQDTMPCQQSPGVLTQPLSRKAEDFPRGGKHSKHVLLLTYLAWLQPTINKHVKNKDALLVVKALLVGKSLIKNSGHIN